MGNPYLNPLPVAPEGAPPVGPTQISSGMATWSMILGIVSMVLFLCIGGAVGLVAIILGIIALVRISKSNGLLTGKGKAFAGVILGTLAVIANVGMFFVVNTMEPSEETAFSKASGAIVSSSGGIGYGNTDEARLIAVEFAESMKMVRDEAIDGEDSALSISGGNFLTYCQLNEDSAVFLVHVPDLRNYEEDAKEFIADMAWTMAQQRLQGSSIPLGSELRVATKGVVFWDKIYLGELKSEDDPEVGIRSRNGNESDLEALFPQTEPEETLDAQEPS